MPITVSIVEDNEQLRGTLARMIDRAEGFRCLSHFGSAEEALAAIPSAPPDVILMDINLPGINGVECVRRLKAAVPAILVVMLTAYEDTENIFNALAAGATGYLLKRAQRAEILEAIREVHRGGSPMTAHIARKVVLSFQKPAVPAPVPHPAATTPTAAPEGQTLSPREQEVLNCLSHGLMYKEISDKLGLSYETVHTYIRRIYEKLQVRTRTEAVAKFLRQQD
jgi:DNA-binding NarL/FixJ family response regulator